MTSAKKSYTRRESQDFLAVLAGVYRNRKIQRDPFGRRAALPSEVARVLAQHAVEPRDLPSLTDESGGAAVNTHLKAGEG